MPPEQTPQDIPLPSQHSDDEHTPLLAMWYQIRTALAEFTIPALAGLKVVWLIIVSPLKFFRAYLYGTKELAALRSPVDLFWRSLTPADRVPLDAAQFLLFSILTAAIAGVNAGNADRLAGAVSQTSVINSGLNALAERSPAVADALLSLQTFWENPTIAAIRAFFDRDLVTAVVELFVTLFITMLFAYLFRLIAGRHVSATRSYAFWLYMTGMQFFTTAILVFILNIASLPVFDLLDQARFSIQFILETGLLILWQYILPLFVLPRIFPPLTLRRTLLALLITHGVFFLANWVLRVGFTTVVVFFNSLLNGF